MKRLLAAVAALLLLPGLQVYAQSGQSTQSGAAGQSGQSSAGSTAPASGNSQIVNALISSFDRGDESTKLAVLNQATNQPASDISAFYSHSLDYVVSNAPSIDSDSTLKQMTALTLGGIQKGGSAASLPQLWRLFNVLKDPGLQMQNLNDIAALGQGDAQSVINLNVWISQQALSAQGGAAVNAEVLGAGVRALAQIGDSSSIFAFMQIVVAQISDPISSVARQAIIKFASGANADTLLSDAISRMDATHAPIGFSLVQSAKELNADVVSQIAANVLRNELQNTASDLKEQAAIRDFRATLTNYLQQHPVQSATQPLIDQFNRTVQEYDHGQVVKSRVLEAVAALGATGATEAAQRLANYLDLINTYTENDRSYDTQIVLAVMNNLKQLKSQVAYQPLFYSTLLKYPQEVQKAAAAALAALQK